MYPNTQLENDLGHILNDLINVFETTFSYV